MKILMMGDLHGKRPVIRVKDFDCIVCVGDFCDDKKIAKLYRAWFQHIKENGDESLSADDFFLSIGYDEKRMERLEAESLRAGMEILKYLDGFNKPIFLVPGNWDQSYGESKIMDENRNDYSYIKTWLDKFNGNGINPKLIKGLGNIYDCQFKMHDFCGVNFIGYGLSSGDENPLNTIRRKFGDREKKWLKSAYKKLIDRLTVSYGDRKNKLPCVFVSHNTPYNTKLDVVKNKNSYSYKKHLGSSVARKFILRRKPALCLCGHMHEGKGKCGLGKTLIVNAGYGKEAQVLIDFDEAHGKVKGVKFFKND